MEEQTNLSEQVNTVLPEKKNFQKYFYFFPLILLILVGILYFFIFYKPSNSVNTKTQDVVNKTSSDLTYPIVDTDQAKCYDNTKEIICPSSADFLGQDAQYSGYESSYVNNNNGTISDQVTGLMWQQSPDTNNDRKINATDKMTLAQAQSYVAKLNSEKFAGYSDWRLPNIKELYSLILFDGQDVSVCVGSCSAKPFIDTNYFNFSYGDTLAGERTIDSQYLSSTLYIANKNDKTGLLFGVNFADGRIKGYGMTAPDGSAKTFFVICVRGNQNYGKNIFVDNGNQTVTDTSTNLTWSKDDSKVGMNWQNALAWVQQKNKENYLGYNDWRLPNAKELQSLVDYSRSPDTTNSAAIDPLFNSTQIKNEAGANDYPYYWTNTTHTSSDNNGTSAIYISFGRALGYMNSNWVDVHGAGAQRSDPKIGDSSQFPQGHGPQGDAVRINNYVRLVRGGNVSLKNNVENNRPSIQISGGTGSEINKTTTIQPTASGTPPQEAINACTGKNNGSSCNFTSPQGNITGTCRTAGTKFACVP